MLGLSLQLFIHFTLFLFVWFEEVLTTLELKIQLAWLLRWWEWSVNLFLRWFRRLLRLDILFLELRQKAVP